MAEAYRLHTSETSQWRLAPMGPRAPCCASTSGDFRDGRLSEAARYSANAAVNKPTREGGSAVHLVKTVCAPGAVAGNNATQVCPKLTAPPWTQTWQVPNKLRPSGHRAPACKRLQNRKVHSWRALGRDRAETHSNNKQTTDATDARAPRPCSTSQGMPTTSQVDRQPASYLPETRTKTRYPDFNHTAAGAGLKRADFACSRRGEPGLVGFLDSASPSESRIRSRLDLSQNGRDV